MKNRCLSPWALIVAVLLSAHASAQQPQSNNAPVQDSPTPEMARLAKVLEGDWKTTETMERSQLFPSGGSRDGVVHARLAAGGTTLIYEVHSDGSAGALDGMLVIWWDKGAGLYRLFICFNNPRNPCKMRGTAHWDGDTFINDYEETVNGKATQWRDSFTFGAESHVLVAAMDVGHGTMKTLITTRATRR